MTWLVAGAMALIGAIGNGIGAITDAKRNRTAAQNEKNYINDLYNAEVETAETQYEAAKKEANKNAKRANLQADLTDKSLDVGERSLSNDINTAIDNLYLSETNDTYEWNQQAMAAGQSEGAAYSNIAASGVRAGSSLSDAVEMQSATNAELLQFSQDAKRRSDNNNLGSVLNQLAGNEFNIEQNRIGADQTRQDALDLVNSYLEGGTNYNLYQQQLYKMERQNKYQNSVLDQTIKDNKFFGGNGNAWLKLGTSMLTGGASGFQTGYDLYQTDFKSDQYWDFSLFKKKNKSTVS